jgi:formate dehydrogenase alpha subunit
MLAEKVVRSTCPYCGVGCQMLLNIKDDRIFRIDAPFAAAPNFGRLCVKGRFGTDYVHHPERLTKPLIRRTLQKPGKRTASKDPADWREATWDEALNLVIDRLLELRRQYGPDSITCNVCAKATNEDNYLLQKYIRGIIGTNNVDHCTRLCHAGSVKALQLALGTSAMSNSIAEMKDLECFIITGSNTSENHPVMATFLKQAVTQRGAKLIVIDPRQAEMASFATLFLQQKPGTDTAVFNAMAHVIVKEKLYDDDFIARRTEGFFDYLESLEDKTPEWAEAISGVPADDIRAAARMYARADRAAIYWGMGISQSVHGTDNALTLINLALMCGHIGQPGTGLNPLRGQNNVQGCSDSGGMPNVYTAYQLVTDPDTRRKFERAWHTQLPAIPGLTTTEHVGGILDGQVKGWYIMGENPLMSEPDLNHARHAVQQLEFYVAQDIFFNETSFYADVVLPAAAFAEKDGTFTNSDRRIQRVRKAIEPPGEARADWEIVSEVARRTIEKIVDQAGHFPQSPAHELDQVITQNADRMMANWSYPHPEEIWEEMRHLTSDWYGVTYDRLEREGGVHWPCPSADHPGSPYLFEDSFPSGRGKFFPVEFTDESERPNEEYPFILSTGRLLYHWHGGTLTRVSALDQIWPECTVEMHPHDAAQIGLAMGEWIDIFSPRGKITARLLVTQRSPQGTVFIPFHFAEAAANVLTNNLIDERAKIPDYKVCRVKVKRAAEHPIDRAGIEVPLEERGTIKDVAALILITTS